LYFAKVVFDGILRTLPPWFREKGGRGLSKGKQRMKRNLTIREAAEFIGCSTVTVRRLINDGELLAFPLRGQVRGGLRVVRESIEAYERRQAEGYHARNGIIIRFDQN
jgi:excisionase family DNA binding protein